MCDKLTRPDVILKKAVNDIHLRVTSILLPEKDKKKFS